MSNFVTLNLSFCVFLDDLFRINNSGVIFAHESAWNEEPKSVFEKFRW